MPYVIYPSGSDTRSVSKQFEPEIIGTDLWRCLSGTLPLTAEVRASIPKKLRVGRPLRGRIPHILGWSVGPWIVSGIVREIIEELEPGVQEFSPIEIVSKDGKRSLATYYLILPPPQLDAIIPERTEFDGPYRVKARALCTLRGGVIRGHHLWRAPAPLELNYFCSDELCDQLKAQKLDGWDLRHRCVVE